MTCLALCPDAGATKYITELNVPVGSIGQNS
jgi:hypothetical protein